MFRRQKHYRDYQRNWRKQCKKQVEWQHIQRQSRKKHTPTVAQLQKQIDQKLLKKRLLEKLDQRLVEYLFKAVRHNKLQEIIKLQNRGVDVNEKIMDSSALDTAIRERADLPIIDYLIHKSNKEIQSSSFLTAMNTDNMKAVRLLAKVQGIINRTSIQYAIQHDCKNSLRNIIQCHDKERICSFILHTAIKTQNEKTVKMILEEFHPNLTIKYCFNPPFRTSPYSLWNVAIKERNMNIIEMLENHGADINEKVYFGGTALHRAINLGNMELAKFLITKGANLHIRSSFGKTPLHMLVGSIVPDGKLETMIEMMVQYGADSDVDLRQYNPRDIFGFWEFEVKKVEKYWNEGVKKGLKNIHENRELLKQTLIHVFEGDTLPYLPKDIIHLIVDMHGGYGSLLHASNSSIASIASISSSNASNALYLFKFSILNCLTDEEMPGASYLYETYDDFLSNNGSIKYSCLDLFLNYWDK